VVPWRSAYKKAIARMPCGEAVCAEMCVIARYARVSADVMFVFDDVLCVLAFIFLFTPTSRHTVVAAEAKPKRRDGCAPPTICARSFSSDTTTAPSTTEM